MQHKKENIFSTRLTEAVNTSSMSKGEIAKEAGIHRTTLSRLLSGKTPISNSDNLHNLAQVLQVDVSWLLGNQKDSQRIKALTKNAEIRQVAIEAGLESEIEAMAEQYKNYLYQFPSINSRVREMFKQNIADNISQFEKWCDEVKPSKD